MKHTAHSDKCPSDIQGFLSWLMGIYTSNKQLWVESEALTKETAISQQNGSGYGRLFFHPQFSD